MPSGIYKHLPQCGFQKGHKINLGKKNKPRQGFQKGQKIRLGIKHSEEAKRKNKEAHLGKKYPNRKSPLPFTKEHLEKMSERWKGNKNPNWQDGKSFEPYGLDWTDILRESIRQRDNYICQICEIHQDELDGRFKKLAVHHIDYSKKNLNPENLISLCKNCHTKTNFNRDYWRDYFQRL